MIVVGAGPTGLVLAGELALGGVDVVVVERQAVASGQSRGGGINPRTCEQLAMRGVLDAVADRALPRTAAGAHFAGLPVPLDAGPWRTRYPEGLLIPQDRLEEILEARLREHGVPVWRRTELVGLAQDDEHVTAAISGPHGQQTVRARFLVGCDGGHSTVRKLTGMPFPGRAGTVAAVSGDIDLAAASPTVPRSAGHISTLTRTGGGYWMLMHPLDDDAGRSAGFRVVFGGPEQASLPRQAPVSADEVARALVAVHGPDTVLGRLRWATRFSDASRQVDSYRRGRIMVAGDAAHIHLPIGGQGLNLGVQDAMNLGWKLAATVHGRAPERLLDSYHGERHPVGARVLATVAAQGVVMNPPPEADGVHALREILADLARLPDANRYLAGMMSGLDLRYDLDDPEPLVGSRMIDLSVATAAGATTVSDLMRTGRGLLLDLDRPPTHPAAMCAAIDHVAARVLDSPVGRSLGGPPPASRILVRPDGYVCWAAADPDADAEPAIRRWLTTEVVVLSEHGAASQP